MIGDGRLLECLADRWKLAEVSLEPHHGGMNSATWFVSAGGSRWIAKAVASSARRSFAAGLAVAARLEAAGIPAGAPLPTRRREYVTDVDGVPLALLSWVAGEAPSAASAGGQRKIGATLAQVHQSLRGASVNDADRFHWVDPQAAHLSVRPWVRDRVAAAVQALDLLDPQSLSQGLLHTDPAPDAFRVDPATGVCGMIDWEVAMTGPLLYDLASAVMYVGGPDRAGTLLETYLAHGAVPRAEVERGLPAMLRFRWAVQADYFARRIVTGDLTGIGSAAENEAGLEHARRWLGSAGTDVAWVARVNSGPHA